MKKTSGGALGFPDEVSYGAAKAAAANYAMSAALELAPYGITSNLVSTTTLRPSVDAVSEFQIQTGTYSAQYGAYLGVHLNMVTKSGTNSIHGNLVEFIRNDAFDARGYFLPATSRKTADLRLPDPMAVTVKMFNASSYPRRRSTAVLIRCGPAR